MSRGVYETMRAAAHRLRRLLADGDGRIPGAALTDGIELACDAPIRVVFADQALSTQLFGDAEASDIAFSAPFDSGGEPARGGYLCLRAGVLARLCDDDPVARFALVHELGHRLAGHGPTPYFNERTVRDPKLFATPGGIGAAAPDAAVGAPSPAQSAAPRRPRRKLAEEAAANVFAFHLLTEPERFHPGLDRLDRWAERYGAPFAAALAMQRRAPQAFEETPGAYLARDPASRGFAALTSAWRRAP